MSVGFDIFRHTYSITDLYKETMILLILHIRLGAVVAVVSMNNIHSYAELVHIYTYTYGRCLSGILQYPVTRKIWSPYHILNGN